VSRIIETFTWLRFHFFLSLQLPFEPGFFPGVGSYPSQQGLGFAALRFVFFAVFFLAISDLKSKKNILGDVYSLNPPETTPNSGPGSNVRAIAMPLLTQHENF